MVLTSLLCAACGHEEATLAPALAAQKTPALRIVLAEHHGTSPLDDQIRAAQAATGKQATAPKLERLATHFIAKARSSGDPGYYRIAESCAEAMPAVAGTDSAALLIQGHVRHALHDFERAEQIARRLVQQRGLFLDQGLLGDVLLDRGQFEEARRVYQKMLDLKPCLQSYARAAEVRWRQGDLRGSRELLELAATAGSIRAPESLAWVLTRQAKLELEANQPAVATALANQAMQHCSGYPEALAVRGRAALAVNDAKQAIADLKAASSKSPLPAYLWAYADALRAGGRAVDAQVVETQLRTTGEREDPRTFAIWLAANAGEGVQALPIAERELEQRSDSETYDALAWARLHAGDVQGAKAAIGEALSSGMLCARLSLHAGQIALADKDLEQARAHVAHAKQAIAALLPSERTILEQLAQRL